jgi:hypothetical protein
LQKNCTNLVYRIFPRSRQAIHDPIDAGALRIHVVILASLFAISANGEDIVGKEFEEMAKGNRAWDRDAVSSDESPRSRMSGPTFYAAVPLEAGGFLFRRGDMLYRLDKR